MTTCLPVYGSPINFEDFCEDCDEYELSAMVVGVEDVEIFCSHHSACRRVSDLTKKEAPHTCGVESVGCENGITTIKFSCGYKQPWISAPVPYYCPGCGGFIKNYNEVDRSSS